MSGSGTYNSFIFLIFSLSLFVPFSLLPSHCFFSAVILLEGLIEGMAPLRLGMRAAPIFFISSLFPSITRKFFMKVDLFICRPA